MGATFFSISCFNNFLLIDTTVKSKISSDQKRKIFAANLYPLSFFANTPFKEETRQLFPLFHLCKSNIPLLKMNLF